MNARLISKFILLSISVVPALAAADTLNFNNADLGNDYTLNYNGQSFGVFVGSLSFTLGSGTTPVELFCVDLDHDITPGMSYPVNIVNTLSLPTINSYRLAGDIYNYGISTATDADHAAALQIAIWDEVYGNKFTLSGVSTAVQNEANNYLTNGVNTNAGATLYDTTTSNGQKQIGAVPEPAGFAVLGIGMIGLFVRRRRQLSLRLG